MVAARVKAITLWPAEHWHLGRPHRNKGKPSCPLTVHSVPFAAGRGPSAGQWVWLSSVQCPVSAVYDQLVRCLFPLLLWHTPLSKLWHPPTCRPPAGGSLDMWAVDSLVAL